MSQTQSRPDRAAPPNTPRWVKISGIIVVLVIVVLVIMHLTGNGFTMHHGLIPHAGNTADTILYRVEEWS